MSTPAKRRKFLMLADCPALLRCMVLILLGMVSGCATVITMQDIDRAIKTSGLKSGVYKEYYRNKTLKLEVPLIDGKKNGVTKIYDQHGHLFQDMTYVNDVLHGDYHRYFIDEPSTGNLVRKGTYVEGKKQGIAVTYYRTGEILEEIPMKDNLAQGLAKTYYKDGKIHFEGEYKDNKILWVKEYSQDGNLINEFKFKDGKKEYVVTPGNQGTIAN